MMATLAFNKLIHLIFTIFNEPLTSTIYEISGTMQSKYLLKHHY